MSTSEIKITGVMGDMTQKFKTDTEGKRRTHLTLKIEVKDGHKRVPDISKLISKPTYITFEELQPGLIKDDE